MREVIVGLVGEIKALEARLQAVKGDFEAFIADKSIPLSERWQLWLDAPESLKNTGGWISDGRLKAFELIGYGGRNKEAITYEGGLVWAERYETINMVEIIEGILESLLDKFEVEIPEDMDWEDLDAYADVCPELYEFFVAYREELLEKNLLSYEYDW